MRSVFNFSAVFFVALSLTNAYAQEADDPELIFRKTTVWRMLSPDATLDVYGVDDPVAQGVSCHFTIPKIGGWKGWAGFAEERPETSLACHQIGPIQFKETFKQGEEVYHERRSLFFKRMRIVRGCDIKRNVLVYLSYTDKLIEGSPQNSTSTVPIMPWGDSQILPRCSDYIEK